MKRISNNKLKIHEIVSKAGYKLSFLTNKPPLPYPLLFEVWCQYNKMMYEKTA